VLRADIEDRRQVLEAVEQEIAAHRSAAQGGCGPDCDHPLERSSAAAWTKFHEFTLHDAERRRQYVLAELWALASDGAARLEKALTEDENILRYPAEAEEEDYWIARHEAAHAVVGLVLGRTLRSVSIEPDLEHHLDNRGTTHWIDAEQPPRNLDAVTSFAGVIAGPDPSVVEGDLEHLREIDGEYANFQWGARRVYRTYERVILDFTDELLRRRAMTGEEATEWLANRLSGG
jgi:hypothetical protein